MGILDKQTADLDLDADPHFGDSKSHPEWPSAQTTSGGINHLTGCDPMIITYKCKNKSQLLVNALSHRVETSSLSVFHTGSTISIFSFKVVFFLYLIGLSLPSRLQKSMWKFWNINAFRGSCFFNLFKEWITHKFLFTCSCYVFSFSGQESSARHQGEHRVVQKWSAMAAAGDLARASHQDMKACSRVEIRN